MSIIVWALLLVFFAPADGFQKSYRLNTFDTQDACEQERKRVGFDMAAAYPNERDFEIVCRPLTKQVEPEAPKRKQRLIPDDGSIIKAADVADTSDKLPDPMRKILSAWLERMYPSNDDIRMIVLKVQPVEGIDTKTLMFAVRIMEQEELVQDYLLFVAKGHVYGWTKARFPQLKMPMYDDSIREKLT